MCISTRSVSLEPRDYFTVCPGDTATFRCMTTGGALVWRTSSATGNIFFNEANQPPVTLGIFRLRLLGFEQTTNGSTAVVEVNSTATATNVQLVDNGVTLNCSESSKSGNVQATLAVGGKFLFCNVPSIIIMLNVY